jgi:2-polyprenyl-3-methyl-5-hydroxy-6-metoxy-1,4-benzoquinol methylase
MITVNTKTSRTELEWEDLARLDPFWAVLSDKRCQFGQWDHQEFFASGQREIDRVMETCGFSQGDNGRVLDFGCGVGRLSRALQLYFGEVHAVDISEQMLGLAKQHAPSCQFRLNRDENLRGFRDDFFDFVYSNIVLQHQRSKEIAKSYIREFIRVVKPGSQVVFQVPERLTWRDALQPRRRAYSLLKAVGVSPENLYRRLHLNPMRTICLCRDEIETTIRDAGGEIVRVRADRANHHSRTYIARKMESSGPMIFGA